MTVQKISVIVPAYNAEKTIGTTIRSLLAQDWPDFEIIVVDDGSTDRTAEICAGFCETAEADRGDVRCAASASAGFREEADAGSTGFYEEADAGSAGFCETAEADQGDVHCSVRVLSQANAGPAAARNLALQNVRGDLICFTDADDTVQEDFLRTLAEGISDAQIAVCGYNIVRKDGSSDPVLPARERLTGTETMKRVFTDEAVNGFLWNKIFRAEIIRDHAIRFDEKIRVGEDMLFVEQYLRCCATVQMTDRALYNYSVAEKSVSHALTAGNLTLLRAFARAFSLSGESEYRDLAVSKYVRQYLVFYVLYPEKSRLESRFETFLEKTGYSDDRILSVLPRAYRARFRFYRFNRPLYAACMSGLRGAKDVLFGKDRELKKR